MSCIRALNKLADVRRTIRVLIWRGAEDLEKLVLEGEVRKRLDQFQSIAKRTDRGFTLGVIFSVAFWSRNSSGFFGIRLRTGRGFIALHLRFLYRVHLKFLMCCAVFFQLIEHLDECRS
jgi:hypothetical protein